MIFSNFGNNTWSPQQATLKPDTDSNKHIGETPFNFSKDIALMHNAVSNKKWSRKLNFVYFRIKAGIRHSDTEHKISAVQS
jgi:hypothetical protein